jgi:hypothetical protein
MEGDRMSETRQDDMALSRPSDLPDLYFAVEVDVDGPIPGPYSLLAVGMSCAASFDGGRFTPRDPRKDTFYAELQPISSEWDSTMPIDSTLTHERAVRNGRHPGEVMPKLAQWVLEAARGYHPVFVADPLSRTWAFVSWYFGRFGAIPDSAANNPFSAAGTLDIGSIHAAKATATFGWPSTKGLSTERMSSGRGSAVNRAIERGEMFCHVVMWRPEAL